MRAQSRGRNCSLRDGTLILATPVLTAALHFDFPANWRGTCRAIRVKDLSTAPNAMLPSPVRVTWERTNVRIQVKSPFCAHTVIQLSPALAISSFTCECTQGKDPFHAPGAHLLSNPPRSSKGTRKRTLVKGHINVGSVSQRSPRQVLSALTRKSTRVKRSLHAWNAMLTLPLPAT